MADGLPEADGVGVAGYASARTSRALSTRSNTRTSSIAPDHRPAIVPAPLAQSRPRKKKGYVAAAAGTAAVASIAPSTYSLSVALPPTNALCVSTSACHAPSATFGPSESVASVSAPPADTSTLTSPPPPSGLTTTRAPPPSHAVSVSDETRGDCAAFVVDTHQETEKAEPVAEGGSAGAPPAAAVDSVRYEPVVRFSAAAGRPARSAVKASAPPPATSAPPSGAPKSHA